MIALLCHQPAAKVGWRSRLLIWGHGAAPLPVLCDVLDFGVCFVPLPHGKLDNIHGRDFWGDAGVWGAGMCVLAASQSSWPIALWTPSSTWLHPWCGAELELPHLSVPDDLIPPNQPCCCPPGCFSRGGTSPELVLVLWWHLRSLCCSGPHAAGCGPPEARWQWDAWKGQVGEKSWFANRQSQTQFSWVSAQEVGFTACCRIAPGSLSHIAGGSGMVLSQIFFFLFIQICVAKSRTS